MPNHFHGIVKIIDRGARRALPLRSGQFGKPQAGSLPTIIGSYKSAVTKHINKIRKTPGFPVWQRNYYERIIRNETELNAIREYIENNPLNWELDEENPVNIEK